MGDPPEALSSSAHNRDFQQVAGMGHESKVVPTLMLGGFAKAVVGNAPISPV
jgi:hypothetical protein